VLDQHVIRGLADHPAIEDDRGPMSYAELLHESASIAGALGNLGLEAGAPVELDLVRRRDVVVAVLACARIGVVPSDSAGFRIVGDPPVLHTPDTEVPWDLLIHAGRIDPAPAPGEDAAGYEETLLEAHGDIFAALQAGRTIT
jgi:hypothetical protein